ncbi:MurR/RpiR family transcriptional regulator [Albidovulum sediminicola]|uniref:MurR/RpiR family transcriptional regulator n=1 Tax=Albidovulum sediminicola TaxID=2984331 RepID=A0ABT2Z1X3_9RHOB|nr:MurR/RpiR family transcriptional regulator [Defluviimonas sp. WL0075]MCV2865124.1 MurR/RpiR family transcriptional regulator [Defluviimonas sp. WL0075]
MSQESVRDAEETTMIVKGRGAATDVISALQRLDGTFASREQKVADYVKGHLEDISTMTIAELAGASGVSTPTVIRFCRTLGCDGFREFKLRLAQNLAVSLQYLKPESGSDSGGAASVLDEVLAGVYACANVMRQQLDETQIQRACDAIAGCRQFLAAGIGGGSSMMAQEAANRFFRLGIPAVSTSDSYVLQMRAATLGPEDVLLLFSTSGEADALVAAAKTAEGYGAQTICVSRSGTRLFRAARIPIGVDMPETQDIFMPTSSRYVHLAILDTLALSVARKRREQSKDNLRRVRASLTAYHGRTGPQPLGD